MKTANLHSLDEATLSYNDKILMTIVNACNVAMTITSHFHSAKLQLTHSLKKQ